MKKVYIQPQTAVDQLETEMLIAESMPFDKSGVNRLDSKDILTKDQNDWNIWDN